MRGYVGGVCGDNYLRGPCRVSDSTVQGQLLAFIACSACLHCLCTWGCCVQLDALVEQRIADSNRQALAAAGVRLRFALVHVVFGEKRMP